MSNYIISYNPYQNAVKIVKNGTTLKKNGVLCRGINGKRLQNWFEEDGVWPGFGKALDTDNNGPKCNIEFIGREVDFIDLKDFFENRYCSERETFFKLESKFLSNDDDMLSKLSNLVLEIKEKNIFEVQDITAIEKYVEKIKCEPFTISVLGLMSSGKSTLLNALMHWELLPTANEATTAKIIEIYDNDRQNAEYEIYDRNAKLIGGRKDANLEEIKRVNRDDSVYVIRIYGDIPGVDINRMQLMLRDTPGPDGTDDIRHRQLVEAILNDVESMSTVIYIMDATKLRVESDKELLSKIAYEMKEGGKQANDRFLFVINRVDAWITSEEQTLGKLIERTKVYLAQFEINNPRIFPVTAGLACDIYKCKAGYKFNEVKWIQSVKPNIETFNMDSQRVKLDEYASVSQCVRRQLDEDLHKAIELKDKLEIALIRSGIKGLEYSIREYVEKYAYPIKVSDAVNNIINTIDEKKMRGKFMDILSEDQRKLEKVRKNIQEIEQKKEEREQSKKKFKEELEKYNLPDSLQQDARISVNRAFKKTIDEAENQLTSFDKLKKTDAEIMVSKLENEVSIIEKKLNEEIKKMICENVYGKGNELLQKYRKYIDDTKLNMSIENFDFGEVKKIKEFNFDELKKVAREVTSRDNIIKHYTEQVPNPKRYWWTPWRPKMISQGKDVVVGKIEYVDKEAITDCIISIRTNAFLNAREIVTEAEDTVKLFREFFEKQIDKFSDSIEEILKELSENLSEENFAKINRENHQKKSDELDWYLKQIKDITNIEQED